MLLKTDLLQVSFGRGHTKRKGYQGISEQANTLFAKSEQDLAFADFMMAHRVDLPYAPYSYVLLNCQQALEKRLKAIIRTPLEDENGEVTPDMCFRLRTHDLRELSDLL